MNDIKKKRTNGLLAMVEKLGNTLPHPAMIFVIFIAIVAIASYICAKFDVAVNYTVLDRTTNEIKDITSYVVNLLEPDGIRYMFTSVVENFTGFAPLGTVLVALLGVGVAEERINRSLPNQTHQQYTKAIDYNCCCFFWRSIQYRFRCRICDFNSTRCSCISKLRQTSFGRYCGSICRCIRWL